VPAQLIITCEILKYVRRKKEQTSDYEYKKLISCLDTTKYVEFRDFVIINLIFDSGMRLGETLALSVQNKVLLDTAAEKADL
jgi:integrase/recombinase XerD